MNEIVVINRSVRHKIQAMSRGTVTKTGTYADLVVAILCRLHFYLNTVQNFYRLVIGEL